MMCDAGRGIPGRARGKLFVKGGWVALQNGVASGVNGGRVVAVVLAILALAPTATGGGRGKTLAVQLETAVCDSGAGNS
jgi:hypothetical protein